MTTMISSPISRQLLINGQHVPSANGMTVEDRNPYTGEVMATFAAATTADVTRAIDAAAAAFPDWSTTAPSARRRIFLKAADLLESRGMDAVSLMARETGGTMGWALFNVGLASEMLREAAAACTAPIGEVLPTDTPGNFAMGIRQPAGVVAAFAPWNAPIILSTRAVAVPLAVGNTVVLKPSEEAPIVAGLFIADVLHEAGLPPGVLNVVTNAPADAGEIAAALIADPRVRRVNFTGSTATGRIIGQLAARHLKPAVLELGGKNALIVLDDADLDYAVNATAFAAYMNAGQICMSADRIIVERSIADELTRRLADKARSLKSGDPTDPSTAIGPVISTRAAERIDRMVKDAVAEGARVVAGGELEGNVYAATVLSDVTPSMRVYVDEIFGPVCTVLTVEDAEEAIRVANDTPYGLTAGVLTRNMVRGLDVARQLQTGIVHVNDQPVADEPFAPFGGVKESGYGRFGGRAGIESFTDLRWITIQQTSHPFPI